MPPMPPPGMLPGAPAPPFLWTTAMIASVVIKSAATAAFWIAGPTILILESYLCFNSAS